MTASRPRCGCSRTWCEAILLAIWILLVGGGPVEGQSPHYRVAVLTPGMPFSLALDGLREGLAQLGYHEGEVAFIIEDAQGDIASLAARAARLVETKPDIIFTIATAPTAAAKQTATTLPIVFAFVADPLRAGFIASYASSQNNVTGITSYTGPLSGKRLEVLQEITPGIKRVLALVASREPVATMSFPLLAEAASKLGIEILRHDVTSKEDIAQILQAMPKGAVDALYFVPSTLVGTHMALLIHKAKEDKIPLIVTEYSMVEQGALVSYGTDFRLLGIQAAKLVVKVLQGAKPSEMPVQTPEQFVLTLNLTTARAIGLDVPPEILERAERVVE